MFPIMEASPDRGEVSSTAPMKLKVWKQTLDKKTRYREEREGEEEDEGGVKKYTDAMKNASFTEQVLMTAMEDHTKLDDSGDPYANYESFGGKAKRQLSSLVDSLRRELEKVSVEANEKTQELHALQVACGVVQKQNAFFDRQTNLWEDNDREVREKAQYYKQDEFKDFPIAMRLKDQRAEEAARKEADEKRKAEEAAYRRTVAQMHSESSGGSFALSEFDVVGREEDKQIKYTVEGIAYLKKRLHVIDFKVTEALWITGVRKCMVNRLQDTAREGSRQQKMLETELAETLELYDKERRQQILALQQKEELQAAMEKSRLNSQTLASKRNNQIQSRKEVLDVKEEFFSLTPMERRAQVVAEHEARESAKRQSLIQVQQGHVQMTSATENLKENATLKPKVETMQEAMDMLEKATGVRDLNEIVHRVCSVIGMRGQVIAVQESRELEIDRLTAEVNREEENVRNLRQNRSNVSLLKETDRLSESIKGSEKRLDNASVKYYHVQQLFSTCKAGFEMLHELLRAVDTKPEAAFRSIREDDSKDDPLAYHAEIVDIIRTVEQKESRIMDFFQAYAATLDSDVFDPTQGPDVASASRPGKSSKVPPIEAMNAHLNSRVLLTASTSNSTPISHRSGGKVNLDRIYLGGKVSHPDDYLMMAPEITPEVSGGGEDGEEEEEEEGFRFSPSGNMSPIDTPPRGVMDQLEKVDNQKQKMRHKKTPVILPMKYPVVKQRVSVMKRSHVKEQAQDPHSRPKKDDTTWWQMKEQNARRKQRRRTSVQMLNPNVHIVDAALQPHLRRDDSGDHSGDSH